MSSRVPSRQVVIPSRQQVNPSRQDAPSRQQIGPLPPPSRQQVAPTPRISSRNGVYSRNEVQQPGNPLLQVVKSDVKANGEALHLVRPQPANVASSDEIIGRLVNQYDYKRQGVRADQLVLFFFS